MDGKKVIEGEFLNGNYWNTREYGKDGNIINEIKNGKGKEYDEERTLLFEGEYLNNLRHGIGKEYYNVKEYDMNNNIIYELKSGKGLVKQFNK